MRIAVFLAAATALAAGEQKLGKPLQLAQPSSVEAVTGNPAPLLGKTVQVKGKITEVCQMMGCWIALVEPGKQANLRVKVADGEIVFPKDSVGKMAIAEGKLTKLELTKEQVIARARHEAEEQGRKFDASSVKRSAAIYELQGTGAVILD
ncbi:MAG: DUF4920 domain-containing protein [Acidobacteriia bacterium]|nr:DUF4920 domain-containing protein [Terriglobia bacterium]